MKKIFGLFTLFIDLLLSGCARGGGTDFLTSTGFAYEKDGKKSGMEHGINVPEAIAALVDEEEVHNIAMRNQICLMLSQEGIAGLIPFADMVDYLETVQE